ncbi:MULTISPECIES: hypothetical protein [Nostocales]|uniref:Uncharacterized protein n=3 Tax=Nostocales TaxID=1161 RepID=A0A0C1R5P5_9CYAN|nr:hypothetical protein [Tolypothrix bouteillei]KAF3888189.1 hypothetical protein DA73_0400023870 [Tolypothrix bouteillei VB521301]
MKRKHFWHEEDSHPVQVTSADIILRQQLEYSISRYFYEGCDRNIQDLLAACRWYVTSQATGLTLVIECTDQITNWRILQQLTNMAELLHKVVSSAKIRVCPPKGQGMPFEMRVDELSVYRNRA